LLKDCNKSKKEPENFILPTIIKNKSTFLTFFLLLRLFF